MTEQERILSETQTELSRMEAAAAVSYAAEKEKRLKAMPELSLAHGKLLYIGRIADYASMGKKVPDRIVNIAGPLYAPLFSMSSEDLEKERKEAEKTVCAAEISLEEGNEKYYCSVCRDRGFTVGGNGETKRCVCFDRILAKKIRERSGLPEGDFELKCPPAGLYSAASDKERYGSSETPEKCAEKAYRQAKDFIGGESGQAKLFITGRVGVGKTYLACCIGAEAARRCMFVCYGSISAVLDAIQNRFFAAEEDQEAYDNRRAYIETSDVLIIDDLGVEYVTDKRFESLITLLDKRTDAGKKTVVTSNLGLREIKTVYGERLFSRFADLRNTVNIRLLGDDIRLSGAGNK